MVEPNLLDTGTARSTVSQGDEPILSRLNRYGFRLVMLADLVVLSVVLFGTMWVRFGWDWPTYSVATYLASFAIVLLVFGSSLYLGGLYEREPRLGASPALPRAARQMLAAGGLFALLRLAVPGLGQQFDVTTGVALALPLPNLVVLIVVGAIGVAGNRWLVHRLRTHREGPPRVVLAGDTADVEVARRHLDEDRARAIVVAEVLDPSQVLDTLQREQATDLVVVTGEWVTALYPEQVRVLDRLVVPVLVRVTARETLFGLERIREIGGLPFVLLRTQTMPRSRAHFKRLFDLIVLLAFLPVILVVLFVIALYQAVVVGRPLLYWQPRVGARGRVFRIVKFRTMVPGAEADGRGARLAERDDPRIIPACRWVRATRMDELPQLWNVLRGEMSLVGPRPERPELAREFERQIPGYERRHELPPGLTGLAQVNGRYHTDPEYKLGYDLQYLVNWSAVLDIEILLRTVWVVLARRL